MLLQYFIFLWNRQKIRSTRVSIYCLKWKNEIWSLPCFAPVLFFYFLFFSKAAIFFSFGTKTFKTGSSFFSLNPFFKKFLNWFIFLIRRKPHLFASPSVKLDCWLAGWLASALTSCFAYCLLVVAPGSTIFIIFLSALTSNNIRAAGSQFFQSPGFDSSYLETFLIESAQISENVENKFKLGCAAWCSNRVKLLLQQPGAKNLVRML